MKKYAEYQAELRRRRRERWVKILAGEPPERPAGRRSRDPKQEELLLRLDRARLARRTAFGDIRIRRRDPNGGD